MMLEFHSVDEVKASVGITIGPTDWIVIDQDRIDKFAEATGDHQWIHVDPERAKDGPFGTTVAHGFLTLSLTASLLLEVVAAPSAKFAINYGTNKVRFPAPVLAGSRIRLISELVEANEVPGGVQVVFRNTMEIEGNEKPACASDLVARFLF